MKKVRLKFKTRPRLEEVWKPIRNYTGLYEASNFGRVRSLDRTIKTRGGIVRTLRGRVLKEYTCDKYGHRQVRLGKAEDAKTFYVGPLILITFKGPCPVGKECRHLDGDPTFNWVINLKWGTRKENMFDKILHGTIIRKLNERQVLKIFKFPGAQRKIAARFGISQVTVSDIKLGRTWSHVTNCATEPDGYTHS